MKKKLMAGVLVGVLALQLSAFGTAAAESAESTAAADVSEEEIKSEDAHFAAGFVDGQSYTQDYFGIRLELDSAWEFSDEEALAELSGDVADAISSDETKEALEEGTSYMDMYAENAETFQNINTNITKVSFAEALFFRNSQESMLDGILPTLQSELEGIGYTSVSVERAETTFLGETVPCVNTVAWLETEEDDIPMYQKQVYIMKGSYLLSLTVTSYFEDSNQAVLDLIRPL